jgi:hypothetical protein
MSVNLFLDIASSITSYSFTVHLRPYSLTSADRLFVEHTHVSAANVA